MQSLSEKIIIGLLAVSALIGFSVLLSIPVWLLWNWLMPVIFGLPEITLLQAIGLNVLSAFLLKSSSSSK